jgi:hypothetical protein
LIIHIAIICVVLVVGGILFFPYDQYSIPIDFDETKNDLAIAKDVTFNKVEESLEVTYDTVTTTIDKTIDKIG